jgi:hypothetical protein
MTQNPAPRKVERSRIKETARGTRMAFFNPEGLFDIIVEYEK